MVTFRISLGLEERPTKRRRAGDLVECNIRVECLPRQVQDFTGEILEIEGLPNMITTRYSISSSLSLYCRKCYTALYSRLKQVMLDNVSCPVMLISGVPGIGKSMFSIYFMIRMMIDEEFPVKECFLEIKEGVYHKCTLTESHLATDVTPAKWTATLKMQIEQCFEIDGKTDLILSDIKSATEPKETGRWTCIFSSPNPGRYKQTMKAPHNYRFKMPTWSEQELLLVNDRIHDWYDRFVTFGGVPRFVLWDGQGTDPQELLDDALDSKGATVIDYFVNYRFGDVDSEKSYMLMHINPPWSHEQDDWDYLGKVVHSFASDVIFQTLSKKHERPLLASAADRFNAGVAKQSYGGGSAGNLFEKIVLWLKPIAETTITLTSLADGTELAITLPPVEILPFDWKSSANGALRPGCLYQPRIANLESGDCFGVVQHDGANVLLVLQMTVGDNHPVKANGLRDIVLAYPLDVRNDLRNKLLGFVIPLHGALNSTQPLHTQGGRAIERIPTEVQGFAQYVCRYTI